MFSILSRRCPLLATSLSVLFCLLSMIISGSRFDLVWFRLSCDHGWIRSGSVNVRKQQQHNEEKHITTVRSEAETAKDHNLPLYRPLTEVRAAVVVADSHIQRFVLATEETTATQRVSHILIKCQPARGQKEVRGQRVTS